jgi:hypothetical protein
MWHTVCTAFVGAQERNTLWEVCETPGLLALPCCLQVSHIPCCLYVHSLLLVLVCRSATPCGRCVRPHLLPLLAVSTYYESYICISSCLYWFCCCAQERNTLWEVCEPPGLLPPLLAPRVTPNDSLQTHHAVCYALLVCRSTIPC